ncbi:MFS general substrate transporter [Plenodomus tracheiphilus IPT5]|uniref:MFS general substrate transporter n=1 Tax=Plenodomus tracheiphilus IPT5 TaxID=1408161 RepID=A0A6A7BDZ2_9PLEO|nr:MFS general substrate transporter [Plenodomus tracheiphilus IPT5]
MSIRTRSRKWRESNSRDIGCEIDNPLAHLSRKRLRRSAKEFAERINVDSPDFDFWIKAALVARYQQVAHLCGRIRGITPLEKVAIEKQRSQGFWQQPRPLRVTIVTLCLAAIIQGWVQTGLNGANNTWPDELLGSGPGLPKQTREIWIFGGVNAVLYFSASILGCFFSDPLQSLILGRRGALFFSACLCIGGAIGSAFSQSWIQLLCCRIVLGAAMGAKASVAPIYGAEVSPTHLRGALVMNWQLYDTLGILFGFAANLIVSQTGNGKWRYEVASVAIPALVLLSIVWTVPESPRYLLKNGRYKDSFASFCAIRETPLQAAAELFYANAQIQAEMRLLGRAQHCTKEAVEQQKQHSNGKTIQPSNGDAEKALSEQRSNLEADVSRPMDPAGPRLSVQLPCTPDPNAVMEDRYQESTVNGCLPLPARFRRLWNFVMSSPTDDNLEEYQRCVKTSLYITRLIELFRIPRIRRATVAALVVMISQQLCGINVLQFYSTTFFRGESSNLGDLRSPGLSLGFGFANFVFTFPVYGFIDRRGRRFLLLSSYPGMIISMLGACLSYRIADETRSHVVVVIFMFCFIFFYSWGQGPVPFAYSSEVFPLLNREAGMSLAVFANLFGAGILALIVPQLVRALSTDPHDDNDLESGLSVLLGIFTGLCMVALILIFFFVPETSGATFGSSDEAQGLNHVSLEELNYIFDVKTRKHVSYQVAAMIPWAWDMCVWRFQRMFGRKKKDDRPEDPYPFYSWVKAEEVDELGEEITEQRTGSESH